MLLIALLIVTNILLLTGIGLLILRRFSQSVATLYQLFAAFWVGFAVVIGFLQIQHFFLPVTELTLIIVIVFSLWGWVTFPHRVGIKHLFSVRYVVFALLSLLTLLMLSNHVLFSEPGFDHVLYHLQTVKWFNSFPIVLGLGNLHHRLAFNSNSLLYASLLNVGLLNGYAIYFVSTSIIFVLLLRSMWAVIAWVRENEKSNLANFFYSLMLPVTLWQASNLPLNGYSADLIIFAIQVILAAEFLHLVDHLAEKEFFKDQSLFLIVLISVGITIKLSFLVFGSSMLACLLMFWFNPKKHPARDRKHAPLTWGLVLMAWLIPWLVRNVFLSGYLLYPSTAISLPVLWKMPGFLANNIGSVIASWARTYSATIIDSADFAWLYNWILRFVYEARQALIYSAILVIAISSFLFFTRKKMRLSPGLLMLIGISFLSMVFWFFSAPAYRFSGAAIWVFYAALILAAFQIIRDHFGLKNASLFSILFIMFMFYSLRTDFSHNISPARLLSPINERSIAEQKQPLDLLESKTTLSGLVVYIPPLDNPEACWDAPLPCTPRNDYLPRLQLMVPNQLGSGFFLADE